MEILTLIIKGQFLLEIIAGTKKLETRDIRPNTFKKYCIIDGEGDPTAIRQYDAIQFYAGYNPDRKAALVTIESSEMFVMVDDETDEEIIYLHNDEEYVAMIAEYKLGKVLNSNF